ncbi:E3 ubiquitin-protein ligase TRIM35 [Alligator mississippiensis]|uniref:Tripartite motif-containing protein 35 n=1 Tax=Alligator mississippiensis TaxID=8496 RepID=A0A151P4I6_ALLMI|nr:E3 ubiquitin-protein ligase TRIM35 [Alligator mississippiensis]KYO43966.1 tripartite motif-containing protein 35 [Alligator mississippiensis]
MEKEAPSGSAPAAPAPSSPRFKEELLCPICYDPFREAVTLCCGHNFCKACVSRSWQHQPRHACPVCKELSSPDDLRPNRNLNNIVEMVLQEESRAPAGGTAICPVHREEAKLFCWQDKELACCLCQSSERHAGHKMRPVGDTAKDYRAKWRNMENSLRDKVKDFRAVQRAYESISKHNQVEAARLEEQIQQEFEKLHEFLRGEEKAALAELRDEARSKRGLIDGKVQKLAEESSALVREADLLQADLREDDCTFLRKHKNRKRRIACTAEEPEAVLPGMLIDVAKYLGSLQYDVWKRMLGIIPVVPFSFDPNSAAGWLSVSSDLTAVGNGGYKLLVDNPERFSSAPCILGSCGFSKGFHTWEVDLGGLENWRVGVARGRSGRRWNFHHDARSGFWYIYRLQGQESEACRASNSARSEMVPGALRRVRVELDCDEGELSFYDAERKSHIYTFHEKFNGEVFPYFYVGSLAPDASSGSLRICPLQVQIREDVPL